MSKIITVPAQELFVPPDRFVTTKETSLKIEHSLVAISKWESKWHVAFLDEKVEKTNEMMLDYIKCMTISQNVDPIIYELIKGMPDVLNEINSYINDSMTATWFNDRNQKKGGRGEVVTSELIYYWMIAQNIPLECEKWHLNRLMTLIRICSEKNTPPKKMKKSEILNSNRALNEARRKAHGTKG